MDVSKHPIVFLSRTVISMTFSRTEDGSVLVLKAVEREVKEGDKPAVKACRMYLNDKLINQEVEGPVEDIVEFDQVCWEMFQKMDLNNDDLNGLMMMKAAAAAAVEVEEKEEEGAEVEEDLDRKLIAKAKAALGKESRAVMIKYHRKTLKAKMFEEEEDCQEEEETESKSDQCCMNLFGKLGTKGQKEKKKSPQKSERSTKVASTNTRVALELKDVSERLHHH